MNEPRCVFLKTLWVAPLTALAFLAGCSEAPEPARETEPAVRRTVDPRALSGSRAFEEVQRLVARGRRDAGTPGAAMAAGHLAGRLREAGVSVEIDSFEDRRPHGTAVFYNVIGTIPGRHKEWVIFGAHFDTKSGMPEAFQGANDSGSGCGVLIEMARVLQAHAPLEFPVMLAFFDGEECRYRYGPHDGLHGSRRLAEQVTAGSRKRPVRAMILLDMVGDKDLTITLPRNSDKDLLLNTFEAAEALGFRDRFSLFQGDILDDHVPFLERGIPAVNFIDFEFGSHPGRNDYWHTAEDRMEHIRAESLEIAGRVALQLYNHLCGE